MHKLAFLAPVGLAGAHCVGLLYHGFVIGGGFDSCGNVVTLASASHREKANHSPMQDSDLG